MSSTENIEGPLNFPTRTDAVHLVMMKAVLETWQSTLLKQSYWQVVGGQSLFVMHQNKSWIHVSEYCMQ